MPRPVFATDLDGCLLDSGAAFAAWYTRELGVQVWSEDLLTWKHDMCLGIQSKVVTKMFTEIWTTDPMLVYPGARAFLKTVQAMDYRIVIITSRGLPNGKKDAEAAAWRDVLPLWDCFDEMIVMNNHDRHKFLYCDDLKASWMLEDNTSIAVGCKLNAKTLREVFLLSRPWNRSKDIAGYLRVKSYEDILRHLAVNPVA